MVEPARWGSIGQLFHVGTKTCPPGNAPNCFLAALEKQGTPIGPLDTLIAAQALSLGVTLVTNNTREFNRVPKLTVVDWIKHG